MRSTIPPASIEFPSLRRRVLSKTDLQELKEANEDFMYSRKRGLQHMSVSHVDSLLRIIRKLRRNG